MTTKTIAQDPRTEAQKKADEAIASGNWSGFATEELLTEAGALELIAHAKEHGGRSALLDQPFRWKTRVFRILKCAFENGEAAVEIVPHDDALVLEMKRRLETDRFHYLAYCQCFGFACFPEDYPKYQD